MGNTFEKEYSSDIIIHINTDGIETDKDIIKKFESIEIKEYYPIFCNKIKEYNGKQKPITKILQFIDKLVPKHQLEKIIIKFKKVNCLFKFYNDLFDILIRKKYFTKHLTLNTKDLQISLKSKSGNVINLDDAIDLAFGRSQAR